MLTIASAMPAGLVSGWNKVSSFLVNSIMPSASTFELASKKAKKDQKQKGKKDQKAQEGWQEKEDVLLATTGLTAAEKEDTRNYFVKMFFAEETGGVSDEAKLGLKTYGEGQWGVCEDYQKYIPRLVEQLHKERKTKAQLRIMSYFGTNDGYVGKAGFKYFSDCWTAPETSGVLAYTGHEIPRMNHDDLTLPENGILGLMFDDALLTHKGGRTLS